MLQGIFKNDPTCVKGLALHEGGLAWPLLAKLLDSFFSGSIWSGFQGICKIWWPQRCMKVSGPLYSWLAIGSSKRANVIFLLRARVVVVMYLWQQA